MSQYHPPLKDLAFLLGDVFDFDQHAQHCGIDCDTGTVLAIAEEAGKFASEVIDPLNAGSDRNGAKWHDSVVTTSPGYREAYAGFCESGWNGLRFPEQYGGQGLCSVVATAVDEMWHAASLSFALCPMLTNGAIEALLTAGNDALKETYLAKLVSGEWTGTMNLTEPSAGSDLAAVQCKALRQEDGSYRIHGQKIFITYGEHDLAENIIHLVLARTPDAPKGVKGISLFVVPKFMVNPDGTPGSRNDVRCASIEHKLGIHGSPTAVMLFGEGEGATGYLVGEENRGLEYMFIMMNEARFSVGLQGLSVSDRAYQHALAYALERVQGRAVGEATTGTIIRHPDVRRMLLGMKSRIEAMRALAVYVSMQKDLAHSNAAASGKAKARMELLVPVLKGWLTESAQDLTYDAVQVFGGMGFIEETGAAQYYRDARILTIYEGTTAIQANDLVGRKTQRDRGEAAFALIGDMMADVKVLGENGHPAAQRLSTRLASACDALRSAVNWIIESQESAPRAVYGGSVPYLHLWGTVVGGWMHARRLQAALRKDGAELAAVAHSASFFAAHVLVNAPALAATIKEGGSSALDFPDTAWLE
ncbi:acyl-CoA dehydrogenase [Noviherbaspirillum denitrificans]|uniref:3-methylmercaptopropionyl-CoA dehydrogenase n=1 Tax=Noviherbaspirillum denitrificans TaxID=1968433 RepID=A0A254TJQ9_9BURK|nr:acyl-CoA dehydrogenase [Noviherbaspirillum denitrificans]OWW21552.1 acyl-CoA dehydrogenase [Noviherbaspirillum denitrificans]